ncbi:hypothetical protein MBAV_002413 [Candidatus Magnetobacterium bavaricum]|uniref:Uncharacterized protein n=1 Tax=Candidatus Magnetobacterium bavaricum TaxID=29290 RepID=A0A0F3GU92_9BACT|nr:hypothetical protein MBAV_002413 [Candidatus Magnetobacterium bavaricum]
MAARAPQTGRVRTDHRGRGLLPGRGLDPAHGQARTAAGHRLALEVPGQPDGTGVGRAHRGFPPPASGRGRPVRVPRRRRPDHEGA